MCSWKTKWVLKHDRDIFPIQPNLNYDKQCDDEDYAVEYNKSTLEEKFV